MAEVMSGGSLKIPCRFHDSEFYRFFCNDCHDFVCLSCLDERHFDHKFCRLESAESIAWEFLSSKVKDVPGMVNRLEEKMVAFENCQTIISDRICQHADEMKVQIDISKEQLLDTVKGSIKTLIDSANQTKIWIGNLLQNMSKLQENEVGIEGKISEIVKLLCDFKQHFEDCHDTITQNEPFFQPSSFCSVGTLNLIRNVTNESDQKLEVSTQTFDDDGLKDEWFDAKDWGTDNVIEDSSDAMESYDLDNAPSITLAEEIELVTKIFPLSEQDAWILADRKLRKICNNNLTDKVYAENIDDIAVMENGCVLLLTKENKTIQKILPNEKIVIFAIIEDFSLLPYCLCLSPDKQSVIIYLLSKHSTRLCVNGERYIYSEEYNNSIIAMNIDGVLMEEWSHYHRYRLEPHFMLKTDEDIYVCFSTSSLPENTTINKLTFKSKFENRDIKFYGSIGLNPSRNFQSYGLCFDKCLVVSDYRNHCVYTLDDELNFGKCVVGAIDGLDHPAAIASRDDILWVADGNKILRFKI